MTGWAYQHDITGPTGKKGDPGSLTDASVKTAHIALSATASVSAVSTALNLSLPANGSGTLPGTLSVIGGAGYRILVTAVIEGFNSDSDAEQPVFTLSLGSTSLDTFKPSQSANWVATMAASAAISSTSSQTLSIKWTRGSSTRRTLAQAILLTAFVAKR